MTDNNPKKILADFHHGDLYESLRILFEERLGWELYRPIGTEWYTQGYWMVFDHPDTAKQYLGLNLGVEPKDIRGVPVTKDHGQAAWLNRAASETTPGVYLIHDHNHGGKYHRGITLEQARKTKFDVLLSSMPKHFEMYEKLRQESFPEAKHIFQMGNVGWNVPSTARNVLNSTSTVVPSNVNSVQYHQEFSLKEFKFTGSPGTLGPKSLCNLMHWNGQHFLPKFNALKSILVPNGWTVKNFGAGNDDGPVDNPADVFQQFSFLWHVKRHGDGYGFNLHNAFACGRPTLISSAETSGQIAQALFNDGTTSIDVAKRTPYQIAAILENMAANYTIHTCATYGRFRDVVNFDKEEVEIRKFLETLK